MNKYGYGWDIDTVAGKMTVGHSGGIHGFNTNMASIPEDNTCVILLANVANANLDKITHDILPSCIICLMNCPKRKQLYHLPKKCRNNIQASMNYLRNW